MPTLPGLLDDLVAAQARAAAQESMRAAADMVDEFAHPAARRSLDLLLGADDQPLGEALAAVRCQRDETTRKAELLACEVGRFLSLFPTAPR